MMELNELMNRKWPQQEIKAYFDSLEPISTHMIYGLWRGEEVNTPHPMTSLLKKANWYGKYFQDDNNVTPIVMQDKNGELFAANPGILPLKAPLKLVKLLSKGFFDMSVTLIKPLFKTKSSKARLRMMDYNGTPTAAMIYDQKPLIDYLKKIDDNTLLGMVDETTISKHQTHYFILIRDDSNWRPF
ncbi:DUF4334 domain-containing protein [Macrococcus equipercicus]|uniref:DUF4334 domain-containing protein n=1 Tax=Macrococcus equipercicus TaxID=69967 RepID=A0ABQ6R8Z1_9STAP|nr:GXWXG domain-containing protein [Macrococcus equipercicus]KAA1039599.1 DUF4334 domain-containing protein [Macrococcus equipercicus]